MAIPHVERGRIITALDQNAIIDLLNQAAADIEVLKATPGGGVIGQNDIDDAIDAHVVDVSPHPIYDDIPSLTTLFENGLV